MKKFLSGITALLLVLTIPALTGCESESTFEQSTSSDCIVTSASIGTIYRILHTTSSTGTDSTYKVAVTGSYYPLSIDQLTGRIFNPDSLPVGTDMKHVVFSTFNSTGTMSIRTALGQDTAFIYTDSIDCSRPRIVTVHATDGVSKREYSLIINVHQEEADTFRWAQPATGDFSLKALEGPHAIVSQNNSLYIYGATEGTPTLLTGNGSDAWTRHPLPEGFRPGTLRNAPDGTRYALATEGLMTSSDGIEWTAVENTLHPDELIAAGSAALYAVKDADIYASTDGGHSWTKEEADETEMIPVTEVRGAVSTARGDDRTENIVMTGRNTQGKQVVWRHNEDLTGSISLPWFFLPETDNASLHCPSLRNTSLMSYDGTTLLTGHTEEGIPAQIYVSADGGRTWKIDTPMNPALKVDGEGFISATTDEQGYVWILDSRNGDLWRGRYNRMGWTVKP